MAVVSSGNVFMDRGYMATRTSTTKPGPAGTAILEQLAELDVESIAPATARKILEFRFGAVASYQRAGPLTEGPGGYAHPGRAGGARRVHPRRHPALDPPIAGTPGPQGRRSSSLIIHVHPQRSTDGCESGRGDSANIAGSPRHTTRGCSTSITSSRSSMGVSPDSSIWPWPARDATGTRAQIFMDLTIVQMIL